MTTPILFRKLAKLKMSKSEFDNIRLARVKNVKTKLEAANTLRKIISNQDAKKTCRLCLNSGGKDIFNDETESIIAKNIRNLFKIEILPGDGKPQHICSSCDSIIELAMQLKQTAEVTQWRLEQELEMVSDAKVSKEETVENWSLHGGYFNADPDKNIREWKCKKCRRIFNKLEEFKEHERRPQCRAAARTFVCELCGKELKNSSSLMNHRLTHSNELNFACAHCPYRGRDKQSLKLHSRVHTGERPAACPHCPKTFTNFSNLAKHKTKHFPPTLQCDLCQKTFRHKPTLSNHIATQHTNLRPFPCGTCGRLFATKKQLRKHELKVHKRTKLRSGPTPVYLRSKPDDDMTQ